MRGRVLALSLSLSALLHALAFASATLLAAPPVAWPSLLVLLVGRGETGAEPDGHGPVADAPPGVVPVAPRSTAARPARAAAPPAAEARARREDPPAWVRPAPAIQKPVPPRPLPLDRPGVPAPSVVSEPIAGPFGVPDQGKAAGDPQLAAPLPSGRGAAEGAAGLAPADAVGAWREGGQASKADGATGAASDEATSLVAAATRGNGRSGTGAGFASAGNGAPEYEPYLLEFRRRIEGSLRYPLAARRRGLSGSAELDLFVSESGRVERIELVRSSSHSLLDEAAMAAVKATTPPPLPPGLPPRPLRVRLPVVFELH